MATQNSVDLSGKHVKIHSSFIDMNAPNRNTVIIPHGAKIWSAVAPFGTN